MRQSDVYVGMEVTVKQPVEAYYSGYAGNPKQSLTPNTIGTVGAVKVECVTRNAYFVCVDFIGDNGETWRAGVRYDNLKKIRKGAIK